VPYPGGKNGAGVYQKIINLMPPHETYIEPFLGGGAIMKMKRPGRINIGVDLDKSVINQWMAVIAKKDDVTGGIAVSNDGSCTYLNEDGINFLKRYAFKGDELVYCDPPYVLETRSSTRPLYDYEMTVEQHGALLETIVKLPCKVMISGYHSEIYESILKGWNTLTFEAMTRGGKLAREWLWFNFPEPVALHDYRYLGENFRERERIKRKKTRWVNRLEKMPLLERRALLAAIGEAWPGGSERPLPRKTRCGNRLSSKTAIAAVVENRGGERG